jgi:hypothetical protein
MVVALVGLAFFVGGLLGSIAMALACAAHDREEFLRVDPGTTGSASRCRPAIHRSGTSPTSAAQVACGLGWWQQ